VTSDPLISAIIVTYNSSADIADCLAALLAGGYPRLDVTVVDNASHDDTTDLVARTFPSVRLLRSPTNLGFAGGNNLGFASSRGELVVVLNPDVRLRPGALHAFAAAFAADAHLGIAGARLLYPDGRTIQHAGGIVDYPLATTRHRGFGEVDRGQYDQPLDVDFVTGAALAIRRALISATGGFDAGFYPVYYEDTDLCYRARAAGWRVLYLPSAVALHRTSVTLDPGSETYFRFLHANRLRFVLKHHTTQQLIADFLPAEAQRLRAPLPPADRAASLQAYEAYKDYVGESMPSSDSSGQPSSPAADLNQLVSDLEQRWLVREQPFVSRLPLLGPLVVAVRSACNSISTRWYVQPLLQQQVEFNGAVVRTVSALARAVEAQQALSVAGPALLGRRLIALEDRLKKLEEASR
jgi:O-antigen biosynthesis protein